MLIDWHVHINDPKYMGPKWWKHPVPMTVAHALDAHRLVGLDRTVISNAVHYIRFCETQKEALAAIESSNRYLAKKKVSLLTKSASGRSRVMTANVASISWRLPAFRTCICNLMLRAAGCNSLNVDSVCAA
jgi:hypothetical protein